MINFEALFKISYGLYIVCSGDKVRGNGFISNTVFQVTAEPAKFAACCHKNNFTAVCIQRSGAFSVSVLNKDSSSEIFARFGYKSGKDFDKLAGMDIKYGNTGVPVVINESIAFIECRLDQTIDLGTHLMFIGELVNAEILDDTKEPITYQYYRQVKKAVAPKNAPTYIDRSKLEVKPRVLFSKYECPACGYIYDEAVEKVKFEDLSEDWVCPACGCGKTDFIKINP
ncbi:MAG: flavin reductase [Bacteroidota bacterium]|jgi:flavin reductase (DIM6/NTAB) family NADH-FMN oxidoreductase RutF/rubredoxin